MPQVKLISYTGHGHPDPLYAARLLAFTKATRLQMSPDGFEDFMQKPGEEILSEIDYMTTTIASSWEFADVTFSIQEVSRATAQQITRTRFTPIDGDIFGSYAMQSQRVTQMDGVSWDSHSGEISFHNIKATFDDCMQGPIDNYSSFVEGGMSLEDARDLLPIGVHCNLIAKYNLRNWVEMCRVRNSLRVQGPFQQVVEKMKIEVLAVWPWVEKFLEPKDQKAITMVEEVAKELAAIQGEQGAMYKGLSGKLAKAADLIKKG